MAGYAAFRNAGFKEMARLEVTLDDFSDGVKWMKDGTQEEGPTLLGIVNTSQSLGLNDGKEADA
jgi:hypothetical protein